MSCINPNTEISAEISETLGSKIENDRNFILRVSGGVLEEAILSYAKNIPNIQLLRGETEKEGGPYKISGNPRRVVQFCKSERRLGICLCNGFFQDLCSDTMLNFQ
jgi:hypothetical protein